MDILFNLLKQSSPTNIAIVSWKEADIFAVQTESDKQVESIVAQYLQDLGKKGFDKEKQGIWIQSQWAELANVKANVPVSAASLTKIATSLAAIEKLGLKHRFITTIQQRGEVKQGVLEGDLIIEGNGDPLLTWEDGIALANSLQGLGIKEVKGDLLIVGNFYMNFQTNSQTSGESLKRAFNSRLWSSFILRQYTQLPPKTPKPQLVIQGQVKLVPTVPEDGRIILRHQSLSLIDILKQMNVYSNNHIAQMLADSVGGASVVVQVAQSLAQISPNEIQLVNGSGLGVDNRISPHAVSQIWKALENRLATQSVKITDIFPVAGVDHKGTVLFRNIPHGVAIKTGTLNEVSALAGVIPTQERGLVWFAILNHGNNIEKLRHQQDLLLQALSKHWKLVVDPTIKTNQPFLGDPSRNSLYSKF